MGFQGTEYRRQVAAVAATGLLALCCLMAGLPSAQRAEAAKTSPAKTYWHQVGNDRFRAYDVGGANGNPPPWQQVMGYPPYSQGNLKTWASGWNGEANRNYAQRVDWPVNFIFRNNASISRVKDGLRRQGLNASGGPMFLSLSDSPWQGLQKQSHGGYTIYHTAWWDKDKGLKEVACSSPFPTVSRGTTNHIRLYADSAEAFPGADRGRTPGTRDDKLYNPYWGFYVLGTSHKDHWECPPSPATWFGKSEQTEHHIAGLARKAWGAGAVSEDAYDMKNREPLDAEGKHVWENNGMATVVRVGPMAAASANPPDDDPNPEGGEGGGGGEEGPPPPNPAKEGDVDGDDKADLVTLHTNGNAYTYKGSNGSSIASFSGTMEPAVFDADGFHVVDVADVNADNRSDMITVHSAGVIFTFMGQANGSFGFYKEAGKITPGYVGPGGHEPIGVADVTGEGYGDLVTFYPPQGNFYIYPGNYQGTFGSPIVVPGAGANSALFDREGIWFVDLEDIDGDGRADLVGMTSAGKAVVYPASGVGALSTAQAPSIEPIMADGTGSEPIGLGDVNGDGKADLAVLNASGQVAVYAGTKEKVAPNNEMRYLKADPVTSLSSQNSSLLDGTGDDFVTVLDFSGDNKADLVKVASNGDVYLAKGKADLTFEAFAKWIGGVTSNRFGTSPGQEMTQEKPYFRRYGCEADGCSGRPKPTESDVDGDRRADLVTLDSAGTAHVYRAIGDKSHGTTSLGANSALFDDDGHHVIDVADVNGDGRSDKVTVKFNGNVYVHAGKADGTFAAGVSSFAGTMSPGFHFSSREPIAVADVTGDAKADLVVFKKGTGVSVYAGKADSTFSSAVTSLESIDSARFDQQGHHFLDAIDVTGDRRADLVAFRTQDDTVRVFKGNVNGTFVLDGVSPLALKLDEAPGQELVGLGDVSGDARADLATLAHGNVHVYEGRKSGEFLTQEGGGPWASGTSFAGSFDSNLFDQSGDEVVGLLDENGDRKADLVTVRSDGSARIYRGKATFTFNTTPTVRSLGLSPIRFNKASGSEMVNEKPNTFRAGCIRSDCPWPPIPYKEAEKDLDKDYRDDLVTVEAGGEAQVFGGRRVGLTADSVGSLSGLDSALLDGRGHYLLDTADVDNDRSSDLISVKDNGKVLVHLGAEDRTFEAALDTGLSLPPVMSGAGPYEPIAVADVTGDGFDDLVAFVGPGNGSARVYKGQADGKFATAAVTSLEGSLNSALVDASGHYFLDVGDVTGDGRADLVSMSTNGTTYVHKGQADGKFSSAVSAATIDPIFDNGTGHEPLGLGDLDGDGRDDLLTRDTWGNPKLFKGKADGTFAAMSAAGAPVDSSLLDGTGEDLIGLIDHDADGQADLVSVTDDGELLLYPTEDDGDLDAPVAQEGDFNTVRHDAEGVELPLERPLLRRVGCEASGCRWTVNGRESADVDGDGMGDLVTVDSGGSAQVMSGGAEGIDTAEQISSLSGKLNRALYDGIGHYPIDTGDFNADGRADLLTVAGTGPTNRLQVHQGQSDGTFASGAGFGVWVPTVMNGAGDYEPIGAGDVDGDGRDDAVFFVGKDSPSTNNVIAVHKGYSGSSFASSKTSLTGAVNSALLDKAGQYFLGVADVNADGHADVVAMSTTGSVLVYKGGLNGSLASATTAASVDTALNDGSGHEPVGLGDVNADGHADLLTRDGSGNLKLFKGQSDATFAAAITAYGSTVDSSLFDGTGEELVGLLDYDDDGRADLAAVNGSGQLRLYVAKADGTFAAPVTQIGTLSTLRQSSSGAELLAEKPLVRRGPCYANGCYFIQAAPNLSIPHADTDPEHWRGVEVAKVTPFEGEECVVDPEDSYSSCEFSGISYNTTITDVTGYWKAPFAIDHCGYDTYSGLLENDGAFVGWIELAEISLGCKISLEGEPEGQRACVYTGGEELEYWVRQEQYSKYHYYPATETVWFGKFTGEEGPEGPGTFDADGMQFSDAIVSKTSPGNYKVLDAHFAFNNGYDRVSIDARGEIEEGAACDWSELYNW